MLKLKLAVVALMLFSGATVSRAVVNAPVNIAYPIDNSAVDNYFTVKFSTTCQGGSHTVRWGIDATTIGSASFYDSFSTQFLHKRASGWHKLWVDSSCGQESLAFFVN
jgi:hypothetical protein